MKNEGSKLLSRMKAQENNKNEEHQKKNKNLKIKKNNKK
jgi:hypothetical protein